MWQSWLELVTDLINKVGNLQGKQEIIIWVLAGAGALIAGSIFYLARCVFRLSEKISYLAGVIKAANDQEK